MSVPSRPLGPHSSCRVRRPAESVREHQQAVSQRPASEQLHPCGCRSTDCLLAPPNGYLPSSSHVPNLPLGLTPAVATQCVGSIIKVYGSRVRLFANHLTPEDLRSRGWGAATLLRYKPEQVIVVGGAGRTGVAGSGRLQTVESWGEGTLHLVRGACLPGRVPCGPYTFTRALQPCFQGSLVAGRQVRLH